MAVFASKNPFTNNLTDTRCSTLDPLIKVHHPLGLFNKDSSLHFGQYYFWILDHILQSAHFRQLQILPKPHINFSHHMELDLKFIIRFVVTQGWLLGLQHNTCSLLESE